MKKQILSVLSLILLGFSIISAQTTAPIPQTISGGVLNGKAQNLPIPEYPAAAKAVNASGAVNVKVTIDEDGSVTEASAVSGHPLLRQAAENAAKQAKFSPTQLSGQAVRVVGVIVYNFTPSDVSTIAPQMPERSMADGAVSEQSPANNSIKIISGGVVNGKAKNLVVPAYAAAAKAVGAEGAVNVQVTIDEKGDVISANAVSGHPLLRQAATTAALASKFKPTLLNGQAVSVTGILIYNFATGNSAAENYNWLKVGFELANVQNASSPVFLNTDSIGKVFQEDWTTEKEQLQKLAEINRAESSNAPQPMVITSRNIEKRPDGTTVENITTEKPVQFGKQPTGEQIAISQSLLSSLQSRLGSDQLKLWQFNTGASLSQALSKYRFANERQTGLDALRQQIQSAPSGVSPEYLADLQTIVKLFEKQNLTTEDRLEVAQIMQRLFK